MISEEVFIIRLGTQIRKIREQKNLSQQNLADLCNVPKSTIARVERAEVNVTIKTLLKIANAIEISPTEFFTFYLILTQNKPI
ncbi:XRE family transcriptional regulator [Flavobacterium psychrophilum]|nr:XRE family transcriptional regulator [Flavobacterium psychrophilum]